MRANYSCLLAVSVCGCWQQVGFNLLSNLGRLISCTLIGLMIGALGSVLVASGHMASLGSPLRQSVALVTRLLLIWFGLA